MQKFIGTGIALVTPFNKDKSIDFIALAKLVEYNIINGVNYLVINGTTAESVTISKQEKKKIVEVIVSINNKRLPLVLGIGGNNTADVIKEIVSSDLSGIDAVLSVTPFYSKPTQEGIYQHFKAIALASPIPIILYNVPGRTSVNLEPSTTIRLANDFDTIIAVKEAGNNVQQYLELIKNKPKNFLIISGDDDLALNVVLAGASGVISVIGQAFPKEFSSLIKLGLQGENREAYKIYFKLMEVINLIFSENNPAGIKAVLQILNLTLDEVRLPLVKASSKLQKEITNFVNNLE
tara:strand:- start:4841 stop:5719 length:879 start_codon:yes stop_codon:yes gene_type:complete